MCMFRNYLKVLIRNAIRHTGFTLINLISLVVGMTVCMQVFVFVRYEKGFDRMYTKNIYRLFELRQEPGDASPKKIAPTVFPAGPALKAAFPQVKEYTRIISGDKVPLQAAGKSSVMGTMMGVDASFLQVFNLGLLKGDPYSALKEPRSIVLTKNLSNSLFGEEDPIGKMVRHEGRDTTDYFVTGLLPDVPTQSHLQFDALYSISTYTGLDTVNDWNMNWIFTYLELQDGTPIADFGEKLQGFLRMHTSGDNTISRSLLLQPVSDIHLYSGDVYGDVLNTRKFDGGYIAPLISIALFVLLLAIINYINLSTARSFTRAKEVAVRKTIGAGRVEIFIQFLLETVLFSVIALLLSIWLMMLSLPFFSRLSSRAFTFHPWQQPLLLLSFLGITVITGIVSGIFPALSLARVLPVKALKGKLWTGSYSPLRNGLVIVQFSTSIALTMVTLSMFRQLKFIRQYDTGFNKEAVIVVPVSYMEKQLEETMMQQIKQIPGVQDVTGSLRRLGSSSIDRNHIIFGSGTGNRELVCANMFVDFNYCSFYRISFIAGRDLSPRFGADRERQSFVINESLARELLVSSASAENFSGLIGKRIRYVFDDQFGEIVGIVRDFNFSSLHQRVEPLCITYQNDYYYSDLSVRLDLRRAGEALAKLQQVWKVFLPDQQFSYYFLDQQLENLYSSDIQTSRYVALFTSLAFVVACLGIIGMAAFNIERRVKEIGVRKVLGATVMNIVVLLSKDFLKLVFVSILIAFPVAWLFTNRWMQNFAYRANLSWWLFAVSGLAAMCVAQLTISFQAIKAAITNPVKSLKAE